MSRIRTSLVEKPFPLIIIYRFTLSVDNSRGCCSDFRVFVIDDVIIRERNNAPFFLLFGDWVVSLRNTKPAISRVSVPATR